MKLEFKHTIKTITASVILSLAFSFVNVFATANVIKINDITAEIPDGMGKIAEKDGRTFVPVRFVSEFLKNNVWFDDVSRAACVSADDAFIYIQNGSEILYIVSAQTGITSQIAMDTSAYIDPEDNRTYLPIRFLAEALGYTVGWDETTQTVTLDKV